MQVIPASSRQHRWLKAFLTAAFLALLASCSFAQNASAPVSPLAEAETAGVDEPAADTLPAESSTDAMATGAAAIAATDQVASSAADPAQESPAAAPVAAMFYNGEIVATDQVNIVSEVSGQVLEVLVETGDTVKAGDPLVRIDSTQLEAQREQALAALEAAQAQLDLLATPAKESDLAAAQAAVAAAGAAYRRAVDGATDEDFRIAEAQLRQAQAAVTLARAAYNEVKGDQNLAARPETLQLRQAELQVEAAQAQYDKVAAGATQDVIAGAYAQLAQAQARLKNLQEGAPAEQIEAAEAQVEQVEATLFLAQLQVSKAVVRAPVDGIVARTTAAAGAMAAPGTQLLALASKGVEVEIPVEELRLPKLQSGQPANIRVAAYPDQIYPGEIAFVAPELDATTRTVRVTVRPTDAAAAIGRQLAPGMSATVELLGE
jgi:multidrug resistance efflux pump